MIKRSKKAFIFLWVVFLSIGLRAEGKNQGVYAYFEDFSFSDISSLKQFFQKSSAGDYRRGEYFFTDAESGVGYQLTDATKNFRVGVFVRSFYYSAFSKDASEVFATAANSADLEFGRLYDIDFSLSRFDARGVSVFFQREIMGRLTVSAELKAFNATGLLEVEGYGTIINEGNITAVGEYEFFYNSDPILSRKVDPIDGDGYTSNFFMKYVVSKKSSLSLGVKDAYGMIYWERAPVTVASIDAQSTTLVDKRKLIEKASISGREFYKDLEKKLPSAYRAQFSYRFNPVKMYISGYRNGLFDEVKLGFVRKIGRGQYYLGFSPKYGNFELGYKRNQFLVEFSTRDIDLEATKYVKFNLSYNFPTLMDKFD